MSTKNKWWRPVLLLAGAALAGVIALLPGTQRAAADRAAPPAQPISPPESGRPASPVYRSPHGICLSPDGRTLYVTHYTAHTVSVIDARERKVLREIAVSQRPYSAAFSPCGRFVYVACAWGGVVEVIDVAAGAVVRSFTAGAEPTSVVPSRDGQQLYVVNAVDNSISVLEAPTGRALAEIAVDSQPRFAVETPDGSRLIVANGLGRSLSIIDTATHRVIERRDLGRCSTLRQIACSSDGRWAFVANLVSHDEAPTLQIERGWIHSNGFTVVDLTRPGHRVTMLLDHLLQGAANPTGLVLSSDNLRLYISLAGIHEIAVVDVAAALQLVTETATPDQVRRLEENVEILEQRGIARRYPCGGIGPRSLVLNEATDELFITNYFSESVSVMDARTGVVRAVIPLGPPQELSLWRKGEMLSTDARMCYQNWFSCASCHQEDATIDGLNWDLANDGLGNPKNVKDLLNAHDTSPAMWGAVRADMNDGIAGGQRFEGYVADEERQHALREYFGHPDRPPNPYRDKNPDAIARGKVLYTVAGCDNCHPAPTYTDRELHDLGYGGRDDYRSRFDTPSIRGSYRTGPWLHDGRAKTLLSLFTEHNPEDLHGRTRGFTAQELDDLVAYVKAL